MKKLCSSRGETLVESLAGILIISLVFVFLSAAIVSAARSNEQLRKADRDFHYSEMTDRGTVTMQVVDGSVPSGGEGGSSAFASAYTVEKYETETPPMTQMGEYAKTVYRYFRWIPDDQGGAD